MKQKEPMASASTASIQPQAGRQFTLAETLQALSFLESRNRLCGICGYRWATECTSVSQFCEGCKPQNPNMTFTKTPKGAAFEQILCDRLQQWAERFIDSESAK